MNIYTCVINLAVRRVSWTIKQTIHTRPRCTWYDDRYLCWSSLSFRSFSCVFTDLFAVRDDLSSVKRELRLVWDESCLLFLSCGGIDRPSGVPPMARQGEHTARVQTH